MTQKENNYRLKNSIIVTEDGFHKLHGEQAYMVDSSGIKLVEYLTPLVIDMNYLAIFYNSKEEAMKIFN